jgi:adenylate cyclase
MSALHHILTSWLRFLGRRPLCREGLYNGGMNEASFNALAAWLTQAGLAGNTETDIVSGFCDRCVGAGLPLGRVQLFIDTLHPVHEGRLFRWGLGPNEPPLLEYGRTDPAALAVSGADPKDVEAAERWQRSPFYRMLQTGQSLLRRRLNDVAKDEFAFLPDLFAAGMTDYVAIITRFAAESGVGEMDGLYSSWATKAPDGFSDGPLAALRQRPTIMSLETDTTPLKRTFAA